jgi:hypothetical protein
MSYSFCIIIDQMKMTRNTSRLSFFACLIFSGTLLGGEPSMAELSKKIESLESKITGLTLQLTMTQAKLTEVSKLVMAGRLELTTHLASDGRWSLVGTGLNGEELGGIDLNAEEFMQKIRSISEQYPNPKMFIADYDELTRQQQKLVSRLCATVDIFEIRAKEAEQGGTEQPATRPELKSEGGDKLLHDSEGRSR